MPFISGLVHSIDGRINAAQREIAALQAAQVALGGVTAPALPARPVTRPTPRPAAVVPAAPKRRPRGRATKRTEVVPAAKLELILSDESDGLSTSKLASKAGGDRTQVLTLLRELEEAGKVRRTGERRTTLWHAYTDEHRIAERTAELEALSA